MGTHDEFPTSFNILNFTQKHISIGIIRNDIIYVIYIRYHKAMGSEISTQENKTPVSNEPPSPELITPIVSIQESKTCEFNMTTGSVSNLNNWLQSLHSAEPINVTEIVMFDRDLGNIVKKIPTMARAPMLTSTGRQAYLTFDHYQLHDLDMHATNMMSLELKLEYHPNFTAKWFALASFFKEYKLPNVRITNKGIMMFVGRPASRTSSLANEVITPGKLHWFEIELVARGEKKYVKLTACS